MGNQLGILLETLRKEKKLSLREAAAKTGLAFSYIRSLEQNINPKTSRPIQPTPETLRRFADAYDYPYEDLMKVAGFISTDPIQQLIDDPNVSEKRKRLAQFLSDLSDEQIDAWLKIIDKTME